MKNFRSKQYYAKFSDLEIQTVYVFGDPYDQLCDLSKAFYTANLDFLFINLHTFGFSNELF